MLVVLRTVGAASAHNLSADLSSRSSAVQDGERCAIALDPRARWPESQCSVVALLYPQAPVVFDQMAAQLSLRTALYWQPDRQVHPYTRRRGYAEGFPFGRLRRRQ